MIRETHNVRNIYIYKSNTMYKMCVNKYVKHIHIHTYIHLCKYTHTLIS